MDLETQLGTRYTVDTLRALRRRFPRTRFVWLMGADNLRQIPAVRRKGLDIFKVLCPLRRLSPSDLCCGAGRG